MANARLVATVSDRALIIRAPCRGSLAQGGSSPHRARFSTRSPRLRDTRTTGAEVVGAMLYRGVHPGVSSAASKSWLSSAGLRVLAYRPHTPPA